MSSDLGDFLIGVYEKKMAPYLDGRREYVDYVAKEDYYLKLKYIQERLSF